MVPSASAVVELEVRVFPSSAMGQQLFMVILCLPLLLLGVQLSQGTQKTWDPGNDLSGLSFFTVRPRPSPLILKSHAPF